tara:strand:- start:1772 stop:3097 length:1326 start_codon:yes stop_codon:yes gene_type:complete
MVSTYTTNGGIEKIGSGEQSGTWGDTTNTNFDIIDKLTNGVIAITLSGTTHTLTTSDGTVSDGMSKVLVLGGSPSGTNTITMSPNDAQKLYFVKNGTDQIATFTQGSGANVNVAAGAGAIIFADGVGSGAAVTDLTALFPNANTSGAGVFSSITANGGVTVDNITIDGTEIDLSSGDLTVDVAGDIDLDAGGGDFKFSVGGTEILRVTNSSSDVIIRPVADAKDIIFQQRDGTEVARIEDNGTFNVVTDKFAINGTAVTSTAAELNILDTATVTAGELNLLDGDTSVGSSITVADADGVVVNDGGTMKTIPASDIKTYATAGATSGTVTEVSTGQGLTGTVTSSGSVSMKNSWMSTSSAVFSISGTSFTNSRSYPVFITGRSAAGGGSFSFSVNNGSGGTGTIDMGDGDSGTNDPFVFILPVGGSMSGSSFTGVGIELRPG